MRAPVLARSVFVALVAVLLAACASEGDTAGTTTATRVSTTTTTTTTTAPGPTKEDFVSEANAICQDMNDAIDALPAPTSDPLQFAGVLDESVRIVSDALDALRTLPVPAGEEAAVEAIWSKVDVLVEDFRKVSVALRNGDQEEAQRLSQIAEASETAANAASNAYGLTVCGA